MRQAIKSYHLDDESHWVANLVCGHKQHVRHDPPLVSRTWVLTPDGRASRVGMELECKWCDEMGSSIAEALRAKAVDDIGEAFETGGLSGICIEGRIDLAIDRLRAFDFMPNVEAGIRRAIDESD